MGACGGMAKEKTIMKNNEPHKPHKPHKPHTHGFQRLEVDGMPPEIALQNLVAPTQNLSSSFKRTCARARYKHWVSDRQSKSETTRLSSRMKRTPIDRLVRELRRGNRRMKVLQSVLKSIAVDFIREQFIQQHIAPLVNRCMAARAEIERRAKHILLVEQWRNSPERIFGGETKPYAD